MGVTPVYKFQTVETSTNYEFDTIINDIVGSIEENLPIRFAPSIAALNAMSGVLYPNGQLAVLTATSSGVNVGAVFVRASNAWRFISGTISNLTTFLASLSANVATTAGATFYDQGAAVTKVFTNGSGNAEIIIGGSTWTNIAQRSGYENFSGSNLQYRLVPGGARLRGGVVRSNGKAIATGAQFATIPSVARPSALTRVPVTGSGGALANVSIESNGAVTLIAPIGKTSRWYSLDNVFLPQS